MNYYSKGKLVALDFKYSDYLKSELCYSKQDYPSIYKNLEKLISYVKGKSVIYKFKIGFSFSVVAHTLFYNKESGKYLNLNEWSNPENLIMEGEDFIKFIDLLLDIFGFKEIVKDYVILTVGRLYEDSQHYDEHGNLKKYIQYSFEVLFDKPDITNIYDNKNRFNLLFFDEENLKSKKDLIFINRVYTKFFNFMDYVVNFYFIPNIQSKDNFKKNYLNKEYLHNKILELEFDLFDLYLNKNKNEDFVKLFIDPTQSNDMEMLYDLNHLIGDNFDFSLYEYLDETFQDNLYNKILDYRWQLEPWYKFALRWESYLGLHKEKSIICKFAIKGFGNYENMFDNLE